jgi:hypothetical protein
MAGYAFCGFGGCFLQRNPASAVLRAPTGFPAFVGTMPDQTALRRAVAATVRTVACHRNIHVQPEPVPPPVRASSRLRYSTSHTMTRCSKAVTVDERVVLSYSNWTSTPAPQQLRDFLASSPPISISSLLHLRPDWQAFSVKTVLRFF